LNLTQNFLLCSIQTAHIQFSAVCSGISYFRIGRLIDEGVEFQERRLDRKPREVRRCLPDFFKRLTDRASFLCLPLPGPRMDCFGEIGDRSGSELSDCEGCARLEMCIQFCLSKMAGQGFLEERYDPEEGELKYSLSEESIEALERVLREKMTEWRRKRSG